MAANTQDKPQWLTFIEQEIRDAGDDLGNLQRPIMELLRAMLLASGDDAAISKEFAQKILHDLDETWIPENFVIAGSRSDVMGIVGLELGNFCFDVARRVDYPSSEHDRLFHLIAGVKEIGPQRFGVEDPDFFCYKDGLCDAVDEVQSVSAAPSIAQAGHKLRQCCDYLRSEAALIARLSQAGLIESRGFEAAAERLSESVGEARRKEQGRWKRPLEEFPLRCAQEMAAQHILIAGELLAERLKSMPAPPERDLTKEGWKEWALAFDELSRSLPDDAEWGLKQHAAAAYKKMVELLPEVFEDMNGGQTEDAPSECRASWRGRARQFFHSAF